VDGVQHLATGPAGDTGELVEQDAGSRGPPEDHLGQPTHRFRGADGVTDGAVRPVPDSITNWPYGACRPVPSGNDHRWA
jgi:hypothetical protein